MSDFFGNSFTDQNNGDDEEITQNGGYVFQVLHARDNFEKFPEDKEDPSKPRRIRLFLKAVDVYNYAPKKSDRFFGETDEELADRKANNLYKTIAVTLSFPRAGNPNPRVALSNLKVLRTIAGEIADDEPSDEVLEDAFLGMEKGQKLYNMAKVACDSDLNMATLKSRVFVGILQKAVTADEKEALEAEGKRAYPELYPFFALRVAEEDQEKYSKYVAPAGRLFGTADDTADDTAEEAPVRKAAPAARTRTAPKPAPQVEEAAFTGDDLPF